MSENTSNPAGSPRIRDTTPAPKGEPSEFQKFASLAKKVVAVPKSEIDEKRKEKG